MKRIITTIAILMSVGATLYAQLPTFEWRVENEQQTSSTTYSFDVNMYNTGGTAFELKAGTFALLYNTAWANSGTLSIGYSSYGLSSGQQGGAASIVTTGAAYFRKVITSVGATLGTSIPANNKVKLFTVTVTNTASFSSSATPNLAWKFNASPSAGFSYTDPSNNAVTVVNNTGTATVTGNQAFCYTSAYWDGSAWNTGSQTAGSASNAAPASTQDAIVMFGTNTQSGTVSCRGLNILSGATHTVGANTLNVGGNLAIGGTLSSSTGTINLNGSGFTANQTVSGAGLTVANLGFGSTGTKTLSVASSVSGSVTQTGTAVLATNGLTLKSTAGGTANVGVLTSGSAITGTITAERYIPANGRRYRFLASPVSGGTSSQWRDNGGNTSGRGTQITGTLASVDASTGNQPSAFWYNEASATGGSQINSKWTAIGGAASLVNGRGYRVFVRGDRSISLTTPNTTNNATTLWVSGTNPSSPASMPVTYNASLGNGWNLVGNPYPSAIDWNAGSGWTKTNVGGTIWIWNASTNSYGSWDGTTANNGVNGIISSGQGFFVQTSGASPVLTAGEAVKTTGGSNMFKAAERNTLRMHLVKDASESDEAIVRFMDDKSDEFNTTEDVVKPMMNPSVNISTYVGAEKYAMVNYMNTKSMDAKVIPLGASVVDASTLANEAGTYIINFDQVDGFDANINIYLRDNYTHTLTDLRAKSKYEFVIDSKAESILAGRLELVFVNKTSSVESVLANRNATMNVYPNPVKEDGVLNIEMINSNFKQSEVSIYNVSGVEVMNVSMLGNKKSLDVQKLSSGVYFVKVSNTETGYNNTVKFIK